MQFVRALSLTDAVFSYSDQTQCVCTGHHTFKIKFKTTASPSQCFSLILSYVDYSQRDYIEKSPTSFQSVSRGLAIGSAREAKKLK